MAPRVRFPSLIRCARACPALLAALVLAAPVAGAQDPVVPPGSRAPGVLPAVGSSVSGRVVAWPDSTPVAGALVSIAALDRSVLASRDGFFQIGALPAGTHTLVVRQVGFRPVTLTVRVMGLAELPSTEGRYVVSLTRLPAMLQTVVVRSARDACRRAGYRGEAVDPRVRPVLEQLEANVARMRDVAADFPLEYRVVRTRHLRVETGALVAQRGDTVLRRSDVRRPYAPGKVLEARFFGERMIPGREMHVPGVIDLADPTFQATHCFRYGGIDRGPDGRLTHRIDFAPLDSLPEADVGGSLWLDARSWVLTRSAFRLTRIPPRLRVNTLEVTAEYREARPGLIVPSALLTVQTVRGMKVGGAKVTEFLQRDHVVAWRWVEEDAMAEPREARR